MPLHRRYRESSSSLRACQFRSPHLNYWNIFPLQISNLLYMHKGTVICIKSLQANPGIQCVFGSCWTVFNISSIPNIPNACKIQGSYRTNHKTRAAADLPCPPCALTTQLIIWPLLFPWPVEISQWKTWHQRRSPRAVISLEKDFCSIFKEALYFLVRTVYNRV